MASMMVMNHAYTPPESPRLEKPDGLAAATEDGYDGTEEPDYLRMILMSRVYDIIQQTPLTLAAKLSSRTAYRVHLKREDLLPVFSFKLRGAYNRMAHLNAEQRARGVIACSAGNHAQGVAYSARCLDVPATVVMPKGTPSIKSEAVSRMGAKVILHGDDFDAAKAECQRLAHAHNLTDIPPFDDPLVIAGQGTIGVEILRQISTQHLKAVFIAVGGGGLLSGIAVHLKRFAPHVKVFGVETDDADAMNQSLAAGYPKTLETVGNFADGTAVKTVGSEPFRLIRQHNLVDGIILVSTDQVCAAIQDVFEDTRTILEPAGALAIAGLTKWAAQNPCEAGVSGSDLIAVASGANVNFDRLRFVAERAAVGRKREVLLGVQLPRQAGAFASLLRLLSPLDVTELGYRHRDGQTTANVLVGVSAETEAAAEAVRRLQDAGFHVVDLSPSEFAKLHARHCVVGGGTAGHAAERAYVVQFPERPGSLVAFLSHLHHRTQISMLHYRHSGGVMSSVLLGVRCEADRSEAHVEANFDKLGYAWKDETESDCYRLFFTM